jgi:hypothetical protein
MYFTLYPDLVASGEFPLNELCGEMVQEAIEEAQRFEFEELGACYRTIILLLLAGN